MIQKIDDECLEYNAEESAGLLELICKKNGIRFEKFVQNVPPGTLTPTGTSPPTTSQTPFRTTTATPVRTPPYLIIGLSVGTLLLLLGLLYSYSLWVARRRQRSAVLQRPSEIELLSLGQLESSENIIALSHTTL
jgi:hypothetical protein